MTDRIFIITIIVILSGTALCPAADNGFERELLPLLENHCFNCHGEDKQEGDLALHTLNPDVLNGGDEAVWAVVLDQLNSGEMPPEEKKRPPEKRLLAALNWLTEELDKADIAASARGSRIVMRRLNRLEYRNTMRDLFGHPFDPTELFSPDTVSDGFDNIGHALVVSPLHVESFVAATERILDKIIDIPEKPPLRQHWRIVNSIAGQKPLKFDRHGAWHDGHVGKNKNKIKAGFLQGNVLPSIEIPNGSTPYSMIDLTQDPPRAYDGSWDIRAFGGSGIDEGVAFSKKDNTFGFKWFAYEEGVYRVRLHVQAFGPKDWQGASPKLGLALFPEGTMWREELLKLNHSQVIEFELYRDNIPWYVKTTGNRNWGVKYYFQVSEEADADGKKVPFGIHISEIEVEGPLNPVWPPPWHSRLFPERKNAESDAAYAMRVLRPFMAKAYRRTITSGEIAEMMRIYRKEKAKGLPVKQALRMPLATILASPSFLFIADRREPTQTPKRVNAFELASRLSYFLWRSMPDEALLAKAKSRDLLRREVLNSEIDRMLKDPKSEALISHFTSQWLGLDKLKNLNVDPTLHPDFDLALRQSMIGESTAFFGEILHKKLSLYTFLDSDFLMLDERLARHYGIPGVRGNAFRKVKLKETDLRGGLLTQAAILTATSNGIRTQPITRGAFVLENILADPPKPPPPDVPAVEDLVAIEPAATLRKRLEQHRSNPACLNCHKKIDPIGFALENYDAIGKWRAHELVAADATIHKPAPFQPGQTITIRFANGSGANTDFIAILPAGVKDDESYKKPGLYKGSPIWKHTTNTKKRAPNGVFSGVISLTAPVQPGEYEARFYFAGNDKMTRARQTFTVTKIPLEQHVGADRPPLLLDPAEDEKTLVSVPVDPAGKLPDGRAFKGVEDFKKLLLEDKDAFLKCLTEKMLVYALGRPVVFGDRTLVRNIVGDLKQQPTLDTLIKAIVTSDAFQNKDQGRAAEKPPVVFKATETFLLWPGTPPGAREGDDAIASATAKAIKDGTYKIPDGDRRGIRVPAIDVYLPPKEKRTGTAMVIYCGGGYSEVCTELEGIPMAKWLNANGIAVFMVSYRCSPYKHPVPHWDVQRAIRLVRSRAKEFDVKTDQIGIMGFSSGGHVTATLSVHYKESFGRKPIDDVDKIGARADFSCLIYPVISMRKEITHGGSRRNLLGAAPSDELVVKLSSDEQIDKNTPPAFLVHAKTDRVVKFINSQRYHEACKKHGVPSKYILMSAGHHWPGVKDGKPTISRSTEDYAEAMIKWIKAIVTSDAFQNKGQGEKE